jgi:phosphatidylglycerophosphate synthase
MNVPTNENNITIVNQVNTPNSRGAGTVLMLLFFGWFLLLWWWPLLAMLWLVWLPIAAIASIWVDGLFARTWYQPWPLWMFGIR